MPWTAVFRSRSIWVAVALWVLFSAAGLILASDDARARFSVEWSWGALLVLLIEIAIVFFLTRRRPLPDLGARSPAPSVALAEIIGLWTYCGIVMAAGRVIGLHYFGEGIAMHLNGSLIGPTRAQSPAEVITWAVYNGILLALVPYLTFRARGYSNWALNLRSENLKNDVLVIVVILGISTGLDLAGPNIFQLSLHQQLVGGSLSFVLHLFGTGLPVMIFIYAILVPRYAKLCSPVTAFLLGAVSYPTMHIFESWARYDTLSHGLLSLIVVYLTFLPPGLMKSFLTIRTGNAWVHLWAFHAISPHVTVDTRLIVRDFKIR